MAILETDQLQLEKGLIDHLQRSLQHAGEVVAWRDEALIHVERHDGSLDHVGFVEE